MTITQVTEGNLTRLVITGTSDNDSIVVSQSGNTLTIVGNGHTDTVTGTFGDLARYGGDGDDTLPVQSSVNIRSLLYPGAGTNTVVAGGSAKSYIVGIGAGSDTMTGNGIDTSFWADTSDTVHASSAEIANGDVHRVASFYQPFTTDPNNSQYIPTTLNGQNLADPTDTGTAAHLKIWFALGQRPDDAGHQPGIGGRLLLPGDPAEPGV